jgi:hypothetical protein
VDAFFKEHNVELWADAEMVRIAGRCHHVLKPMGPAFFADLEAAGEVILSARDRFMILAMGYICIAGKEAEDIISGWRREVELAKEHGNLIDYWTAPRFPIPFDVPGLTSEESVLLRELLRKVEGFESELLETEKLVQQQAPHRTHRRKWAHDTLSRLLVRLYVDAGGTISFKLDEDHNKVVGQPAPFLRLIWEALPSEETARTTSEIFVRRTQDIYQATRLLGG